MAIVDEGLVDARRLRGARILLVDDSALNRALASELLRSNGLMVSEASNGREALERLATEAYDAVLMDLRMPVMDGLEATRAIRAQDHLRDLPVVVMSAAEIPSDAAETVGLSDQIGKPIDVHQLFAVLGRWVAKPEEKALPTQSGAESRLEGEFSGIDVAAGVERMGEAARYLRMLIRFRDRHRDFIHRFRGIHGAGDRDEAIRAVHTLRGSAGNVAAWDLAAAAAALERACVRHASPVEIDVLLYGVDRELRRVIPALEHLTPSHPVGGERLWSIAELVDALRPLVARNDVAAIETLRAYDPDSHPEYAADLALLGDSLDDYDFDRARDLLERLADSLGE